MSHLRQNNVLRSPSHWEFSAKSLAEILEIAVQIGPLQDTITWYKIHHTGMHWDIQNKVA